MNVPSASVTLLKIYLQLHKFSFYSEKKKVNKKYGKTSSKKCLMHKAKKSFTGALICLLENIKIAWAVEDN